MLMHLVILAWVVAEILISQISLPEVKLASSLGKLLKIYKLFITPFYHVNRSAKKSVMMSLFFIL